MQVIAEFAPWLIAMAVLVFCSAFFSCSEAALFYLRRQDRRAFRSGNPAQRMAALLLDDPRGGVEDLVVDVVADVERAGSLPAHRVDDPIAAVFGHGGEVEPPAAVTRLVRDPAVGPRLRRSRDSARRRSRSGARIA